MKRHETLSSDEYRDTSSTTTSLSLSTLDPRHSTLGRFLREPLVHFLLLGAVIFGAFKFISRETIEPGKILITQGRIESLATAFSRTWRRPPTASELEGLLRDYVREEVFAREAVALGLDKDDTIIRRRLHQKLEWHCVPHREIACAVRVHVVTGPADARVGNVLRLQPAV